MTQRTKQILWWAGVPCMTAFVTWGPYAWLNIIAHAPWRWWRVPIMPIVIFDSSAYFEWLGAALSGLPVGSHIGPFAWIIRALGLFLSGSWSVAEIWLFTAWASVTVGIWVTARCIVAWSNLTPVRARLISLLVWFTLVLPFMPRPGVYTWYLPFYLFGLIGVWRVQSALTLSRYPSALVWTLMALAATWTYPYFLVHLFLWLVVLWCIHLHGRFLRTSRFLGSLVILGVLPTAVLLAPRFQQPVFRLALELQERAGLAYTHLPVISNSFILVVAWVGFLLLISRRYTGVDQAENRLHGLFLGWAALLAGWLSNVATGVYIHNDHFRAPAVALSWVSLAVIWSIVSEEQVVGEKQTRSGQQWLAGILALSVFFTAYYLFVKGFVFRGDQLNVVHVSSWLTLAAASWLVWSRGLLIRRRLSTIVLGASMFAAVLGVSARSFVYAREISLLPSYVPYIHVIEWLRERVPPGEAICIDPLHEEIIASFTARLVYPSFIALLLPKSDERIISDLGVMLGHYGALAAGVEGFFTQTFDSMRGTSCTQFSVWSRMFTAWGWSQTDIDTLTGCPRAVIRYDQSLINRYMTSGRSDDDSFRLLCPWVVVARDQRQYWTLPGDYSESKVDDEFSVWRSTVPVP